MRELSVYRMRQFFADELKRLELFEDLAAGINLEAVLLTRRIPTNAGKLILSTRYPEELEAAVAAGRQARKEEDKLLREKMRMDTTFLQERSQAKPRLAPTDEIQSGIFRSSGSLFEQRSGQEG